ncbi:unnamed protein product [Trifolium pratense]|uniref:Uncharacterized protein n=1 Tax=Trifolium pratense TaxID=57577 RepID=A0ACB0MG91_TRIPR|nr:unnamed protein product [Trifolium pratense]
MLQFMLERNRAEPVALDTISKLKYLVQVYKPDVVFLLETLATSNKTDELRYVLGFDSCFTVNREGRGGGGIALLWRSSYNCSIVNFSQNHINVQVTDQVNGNWRLTGFYGFPNGVTDAGLIDVHMEGHPLTWFKSLGTIQAVKERLDRALANDGWFQLFPNAILENLPALVSDHYPILLIREPGNNNMSVKNCLEK